MQIRYASQACKMLRRCAKAATFGDMDATFDLTDKGSHPPHMDTRDRARSVQEPSLEGYF